MIFNGKTKLVHNVGSQSLKMQARMKKPSKILSVATELYEFSTVSPGGYRHTRVMRGSMGGAPSHVGACCNTLNPVFSMGVWMLWHKASCGQCCWLRKCWCTGDLQIQFQCHRETWRWQYWTAADPASAHRLNWMISGFSCMTVLGCGATGCNCACISVSIETQAHNLALSSAFSVGSHDWQSGHVHAFSRLVH